MHHHTWLIFVFSVEMEFCHVGQADLELLTSGDLSASASQSAGITGVSHCTRPSEFFLLSICLVNLPPSLYFESLCILACEMGFLDTAH